MRPNRIVLPQNALGTLRAMRARATERAEREGREASPWYRIDAQPDEAEVFIYDEISWWGITAQDFIAELRAIQSPRITVHINSPGGFVDDGIAIYNALLDHPAHVRTIDDAGAYSIASVIMQAGDERLMNRHSMMMIHDALAIVDILGFYNPGQLLDVERELRDTRLVLNKTSDVIAGVYADRSGGGEATEWRAAMRGPNGLGTWYTAEEAVNAGLADSVVTAVDAPPSNRFEHSALYRAFQDAPRVERRDGADAVTKRDAEQALRDAGLPATAAKAVLAGGWSGIEGDPRDEDASVLLAKLVQLNQGEAA